MYTLVTMKTVIHIKADKEVKDKATKVARDLGLPLSTLVNGLLKQVINERRVSFSAPLVPSKKLERILRAADKDIKAGKNLSPIFTNMKAMDKYLNKLK